MARTATAFALSGGFGATLIVPAAAAPVCGPADARTLAAGAETRVYASGAEVFACHRRLRTARSLGARERIIDALVAGRRVAVRRRSRTGEQLSVYALVSRARFQRVAVPGRIATLRLDRRGLAVFVVVPRRGTPYIQASRGGARTEAPGILPGSLAFKGGVVAWRDAVSSRFEKLIAGTRTRERLLQIGNVTVSVEDAHLSLRRAARRAFELGEALGDCPSSQGCQGVDTLQVVGDYAAARTIELGPDDNALWVLAYDLARGTRREACRRGLPDPSQPGSFQLAADGSVSCGV